MAVYLVVAALSAAVAYTIAVSRGLRPATYTVLAALFPIVGIAAVLLVRPSVASRLTPASGTGWWPDPTGRFDRRYFDSHVGWTRYVARDDDDRQLEDPL